MTQESQSQEVNAAENDNYEKLKQEQAQLKKIVLDHYHCTFFLPIVQDIENPFPAEPSEVMGLRCEYNTDKEVETEAFKTEQSKNAQAYHFFTPHLRNILFDTGSKREQGLLEPMREWQLPESTIRDWELTLHKTKEDKIDLLPDTALNHQETVFESVKLYRYFNGNYLLAFRVIPKALKEMHELRNNEIERLSNNENDSNEDHGGLRVKANSKFSLFDESCNHQYLDEFKDDPFVLKYENLQLEAWLRFSRLARQLFPSFIEQSREKKIAEISLLKGESQKPVICFDQQTKLSFPENSGEQLSPIVRAILLEFFPETKHKSINNWLDKSFRLYDDRMFISVAYSLSGAKHSERTLNIINTLASVTDRVEDVWTDFDNLPYSPAAMSRYLEGSQFDFWQDQAGTYIYTDVVNAYVSRGWFFRDIIADTHIPYIYDRMLIQALFYQTSLRYYDHAITNKTQILLNNKTWNASAEMTALLGEFIRFTNQYWFKEVTNQMQGKEIFTLQLQGLALDNQFEQLQFEINHTNDYLHAEYERQQTEKGNSLAIWAFVIALIALAPVINDIFKPEASLWTSISIWMGEAWGGQAPDIAAASDSIWRKIIAALFVIPIVGLCWNVFRTTRKSNLKSEYLC